jgi:transposase
LTIIEEDDIIKLSRRKVITMPKRHYISEEELKEIKNKRKSNKDKTIDKWLEVLELKAQGKTRSEISEKTGFKKQYITELVGEYRRTGLEQYAKKQYAGNRRNMSLEEEIIFLDAYKNQAEQGQIIEVNEIKAAYEAKVGHTIGGSQIYYVLQRNGWRKVMPRSKHPNKASDEEIESSKKLTHELKR